MAKIVVSRIGSMRQIMILGQGNKYGQIMLEFLELSRELPKSSNVAGTVVPGAPCFQSQNPVLFPRLFACALDADGIALLANSSCLNDTHPP